MTKVFIGGSRRVTRLNAKIRERLDRIMEKEIPVVIGDANGADKAVQKHLQSRSYDRVEVFCMNGQCRNNVGGWVTRKVLADKDSKSGFDYYASKDELMASEASVGLMIWDGQSMGTLANIFRLLRQEKKVVVYNATSKTFSTLRNTADWNHLLSECEAPVKEKIRRYARHFNQSATTTDDKQVGLFK